MAGETGYAYLALSTPCVGVPDTSVIYHVYSFFATAKKVSPVGGTSGTPGLHLLAANHRSPGCRAFSTIGES